MDIILHGAKNSILPLIASTLLEKNKYIFYNIFLIDDLKTQIEILQQFNVDILISKNMITIDTQFMKIPNKIIYNTNSRATYYFIGATIYDTNLVYELGGGCNLDKNNRKIDFHIDLINLSGKIAIIKNNILEINGNINDREIEYTFKLPSVGATINAILLYSKFNSKVILKNCAKDPYISDVINFLKLMGKNIIQNNDNIIINNNININKTYRTIKYYINNDPIEILTYIIFSAINLNDNSISTYKIGKIQKKNLGKTLDLFKKIGIELIQIKKKYFLIKRNILKHFKINTGYFPDIYTDIQPFLCLLSLFINDTKDITEITEKIWNNRFDYINEYNKLGYNITQLNNKIIIDKKKFNNTCLDINTEFICTDLRGGMALYLLLKLKNISNKIINKEFINRGYIDYDKNINLIMNTNSINFNYDTSKLSNIKIGGISKYYVEFYNISQLKNILFLCKKLKINYKIIGDGTNIYFGHYYNGIIIKNKIKFINIKNKKDYKIINCSSGNRLQDIVDIALKNNLDITKLTGIPGTIGGAIYNNAGAYGLEIKDILYNCTILDKNNKIKIISNKNILFSYRNSIFKNNKDIIISAKFKIYKTTESYINLYEKYNNILTIRKKKYILENNLGSIFKNIIIQDNIIYAWKLLDELNYRGKIIKNIYFSETNPNILINVSTDINDKNIMIDNFTTLTNEIIYLVKIKFNLNLEKEIEFINY